MRYEISEDPNTASAWRVQVIDRDGLSYTAYFVGSQAEQRAHGFVERKRSPIAYLTHKRAA